MQASLGSSPPWGRTSDIKGRRSIILEATGRYSITSSITFGGVPVRTESTRAVIILR